MVQDETRIAVSSLKKKYGALTVIEDLNLDIKKGEFISLLGPSGSGKTTLLMILAGFEKATSGSVSLDGTHIENLPPHKRGLGVVFQNYALFPHMTVAENIAFPLKMRRYSRSIIKQKVQKALDMVQLSDYGKRRPTEMSGGQQQRIALARALVFEPRVILMDEPFGALDKQLREQMQLDIRDMHKRLGLTVVFVTHDQSEALTMSDRIAVFNKGNIEQIGTPLEIYEKPKTDFVAQFIGETNLIKGIIASIDDNFIRMKINDTELKVTKINSVKLGEEIEISLRPECITLSKSPLANDNMLPGKVRDTVYRGEHTRIDVDTEIGKVIVRSDRMNSTFVSNNRLIINFNANNCWIVK
ncbi:MULTISPECIES: ABC transporter ATP-binding protein [Bartonella]|uniref:ABC transporter ATP-binding protein n=1 Tax=Bartonella TaxID=773 RepID=UPI0018DE0F5C|nr:MULTISPECIES: ABC transporter ATP-binding protein [Bartonella]MBH9994235.1 ABC transporter ATP-binding protein [Bartonella sp. P0291]MBH9997420.1 ABC transporter ATP-binding protein [Bartonella sp. M0192]MBH9999580.1 ABC transporter ATP-binding protein [Bartonella sp. M0191]MBI0008514.1 ABC transporter ATP-binding protein [Bartonella sp. M0193]MBI0010871.1 ABC transporter ATP-binding protein [Bartonella sp. M0176]